MENKKNLFVDLDGTIIKEDLSDLAFWRSIKYHPFKTMFYLLVFLIKGKPYLKEKISKNFDIPFNNLTFNKSVLDFIKEAKNRQKVIYLISGSHQILVDQMAKHLNIFFESIGTRDSFNMVGSNKIKYIKEKLNIHDFDYIGNSIKDMPIWEYTGYIIFTNISKTLRKSILRKKIKKIEIEAIF